MNESGISPSKMRIGLVVGVIILAVGSITTASILAFGYISSENVNTHPPCDQLPGVAEARRGLESNPDLLSKLNQVGSGVSVRVESPGCKNPDQALIEVVYSTDEEATRIEDVLTHGSGFGVPVYVRER
ncbi:hypothetical protein [Devriesea agamarum]|uniref:hypothetical protein n=1 Tax=Devriesea agamarum TaxID=472569 RepID=UPI00155E26ED|nr:hypothetical protein [Devriesea agamarum]